MASEIILKYDQSLYQAKIDELQGYWDELNGHLETLKNLRSQIASFWQYKGADEVRQNLKLCIESTTQKMNTIHDSIQLYKDMISQMEGSDLLATGFLEEALGLVSKLGVADAVIGKEKTGSTGSGSNGGGVGRI